MLRIDAHIGSTIQLDRLRSFSNVAGERSTAYAETGDVAVEVGVTNDDIIKRQPESFSRRRGSRERELEDKWRCGVWQQTYVNRQATGGSLGLATFMLPSMLGTCIAPKFLLMPTARFLAFWFELYV